MRMCKETHPLATVCCGRTNLLPVRHIVQGPISILGETLLLSGAVCQEGMKHAVIG